MPADSAIPTLTIHPDKSVDFELGGQKVNLSREELGATLSGENGLPNNEARSLQTESRMLQGASPPSQEFLDRQAGLLSREQLDSEIPNNPLQTGSPLAPEGSLAATAQKLLSPLFPNSEAVATGLQRLDMARQWGRQVPGGVFLLGKGGASTTEAVNKAWTASTATLNKNIGLIENGDLSYKDVLADIQDAQSSMKQYEGYIHGLGKYDPEYRIDNGIAMELKLKQYQASLETYKNEVLMAENNRRMKQATAKFGTVK